MKKCFFVLESPFDVGACCILAVKLHHGETKIMSDFIEERLLTAQNDQLWMQGDLRNLSDVRPCIKFIENVVYDSHEMEKSMQSGYQAKVAELSKKFSTALSKFNKTSSQAHSKRHSSAEEIQT